MAVATALLALGASGTALPAARAAQPRTQTWWVHRTSRTPQRLEMRVTAAVRQAADTNEGTLFTLRVLPPTVEGPTFADMSVGGVGREPLIRTYGVPGVPDSACGAPCDTANGTRLFDGWEEQGRSPIPSEWYVAADNLDVTITVSAGWRVDRIPNRFTVVLAQHTGATGVRTNNVTAEHFTHAEAAGGRYGSFAFATIPCTSAGVGSAMLRGGVSYHNLTPLTPMGCAEYTDAITEGVAFRTTKWVLDGDVTGWTAWPIRLLVFSLPHPPRG
jgi:hypothetical protein